MEYGIDMFICDGDSLILRLCKLMSSFDETSAVMPHRQSRAVSRRDLWLEGTDEKKTVTHYVGGVRKTKEKLKLYLRHRAVTSAEIAEAEGILSTYMSRLAETLAQTDTYRVSIGDVSHCETDDSLWDFYVEFEIYGYEQTEYDGVRFYVSFGEATPVFVGTGCITFKECVSEELYSRRYFDEDFYRSDPVGEKRSITFEFENDIARCALYPILSGESEVRVIKALDSGKAELTRFVIGEISNTSDICVGNLISSGDTVKGRFDFDTGVFTADKTERRGNDE